MEFKDRKKNHLGHTPSLAVRSVCILLVIVFGFQLAAPLAANAFIFGVPVATNKPPDNFISKDWIMKWIVNPAIRIAIRSLLQAATNQIVSWIQGNRGRNVGFIGNLEKALREEADRAGGQFLNNLTGLNLCGNISAYLQIILRVPSFQREIECTVTQIIQNLRSFYSNFSRGGWPAFVRITLEPQNTANGAFLIALDKKLELEDAARRRVQVALGPSGKGYLGFQVPVERCEIGTIDELPDAPTQTTYNPGDEPLPEVNDTQPSVIPGAGRQRICSTEHETRTPGEFIAEKLTKATNSGIDFAINAKDFDEAIATIISALVQRIISSSFSVFDSDGNAVSSGEGLYAGNLQVTTTAREQSGPFETQLTELVFTTDASLEQLDTVMIETAGNLMTARRSTTTVALEERERLQARFATFIRDKSLLLNSRSGVVGLRSGIQNITDPDELSRTALRIPELGYSVNILAQRIETDAGAPRITPRVTTNNTGLDSIQMLENSRNHISAMIRQLDILAVEAERLASSTVLTLSPTERATLNAQRNILVDRGITLRGLSTRSSIAAQDLRSANPLQVETIRGLISSALRLNSEINTALQGAMESLRFAGETMRVIPLGSEPGPLTPPNPDAGD